MRTRSEVMGNSRSVVEDAIDQRKRVVPRPDAARALKDAVDEADRAERANDKLGKFLASGNHPKMRADMERVVETMFQKIDVEESYQQLTEGLVVEAGTDFDKGTLMIHLNRAEENARRAHLLYCVASIEKERWEAEYESKVRGAMIEEANTSLQREKDQKQRNKQITDSDTRARAATLHPDEFSHIEMRFAQVKRAVQHFEELLGCWRSRAATLRTMVEARR